MTATPTAGALVRICEVLTEPLRIATNEELTAGQARAHYFNPSALVEVLESNGAYRDPQKLAAIAQIRDRTEECYRESNGRGRADGI
jgi:hypothetical protein